MDRNPKKMSVITTPANSPVLGEKQTIRQKENTDISNGESTLEVNKIVEYLCSGKEDQKRVATEHFEKLMKTMGNSPNTYFKLEDLLTKIQHGILDMEKYSFNYPFTENTSMTSDERIGWLWAAYTLINIADLDSTKPLTTRDVDLIEFYGFRSSSIMNDANKDVRSLTTEIIHLIGNKVGFSHFQHIKRPILQKINYLLSNPTTTIKYIYSEMFDPSRDARVHHENALSDSLIFQCLKSLKRFFKSFQTEFVKEFNELFLETISGSLTYPNALIREAALDLFLSIVKTGKISELPLGTRLTSKIVENLTDNCSQVRLRCFVTIKTLFKTLQVEEQDVYYEAILPPLCLSCNYINDTNFMNLCQSLWEEVTKGNKLFYKTKFIDYFVNYYITSLKSKHVFVQIGAASCLSELATEIDKNDLATYITPMLDALEMALLTNDPASNEATILAIKTFVFSHYQESRSCVDRIFPVLIEKLGCLIPQVRKASAVAIAKIIWAYGLHFLEPVLEHISTSLENICVENVLNSVNLCKKYNTNNLSLLPPQANQTVTNKYPSFPRVPWEAAEGCFHLIENMFTLELCRGFMAQFLPKIFVAARNKYYPQHVSLLETFCQIVPAFLTGLGVNHFKNNSHSYLNIIFYVFKMSLERNGAARICLNDLSRKFGRDSIRRCMKSYNPVLLSIWDSVP